VSHDSDEAPHDSDEAPHDSDGVPHDSDGMPHDSDGVPHDSDGVSHELGPNVCGDNCLAVGTRSLSEGVATACGGGGRTAHAGYGASLRGRIGGCIRSHVIQLGLVNQLQPFHVGITGNLV
jgi:hypothetical protein